MTVAVFPRRAVGIAALAVGSLFFALRPSATEYLSRDRHHTDRR